MPSFVCTQLQHLASFGWIVHIPETSCDSMKSEQFIKGQSAAGVPISAKKKKMTKAMARCHRRATTRRCAVRSRGRQTSSLPPSLVDREASQYLDGRAKWPETHHFSESKQKSCDSLPTCPPSSLQLPLQRERQLGNSTLLNLST